MALDAEVAAVTGEGFGSLAHNRFPIWSIDDLQQRPRPRWVIDLVIPNRGYTIVYGVPGAFKTFIALDLALSIAAGMPWHGRSVLRGKVLYVAGEGSFDVWSRIDAWLTQRNVEKAAVSSNFRLMDSAPLLRLHHDTDDFFGCARLQGPWDLVVVDTIGRVMPGIDDHSAQGARQFSEFVTKIREQLGAATLAVHHTPKGRGEEILGSGAYEADADVICNVRISQPHERVSVHLRKMKYGEQWAPLGFQKVLVKESIALEFWHGAQLEGQSKHGSDMEKLFIDALGRVTARSRIATRPMIAAEMLALTDGSEGREDLRRRYSIWLGRSDLVRSFAMPQRGPHNSVQFRAPFPDEHAVRRFR